MRENDTVLLFPEYDGCTYLDNYVDVAGYLCAKRAGLTIESVRSPLKHTTIIKE